MDKDVVGAWLFRQCVNIYKDRANVPQSKIRERPGLASLPRYHSGILRSESPRYHSREARWYTAGKRRYHRARELARECRAMDTIFYILLYNNVVVGVAREMVLFSPLKI